MSAVACRTDSLYLVSRRGAMHLSPRMRVDEHFTSCNFRLYFLDSAFVCVPSVEAGHDQCISVRISPSRFMDESVMCGMVTNYLLSQHFNVPTEPTNQPLRTSEGDSNDFSASFCQPSNSFNQRIAENVSLTDLQRMNHMQACRTAVSLYSNDR